MRLEAGTLGTPGLIIEVQPRIGKSELSTIRFPTWWIGRHPDDKVMITSYGDRHARRFGLATRNIVESGTFRGIFPEVAVASDHETAERSLSRAATEWGVAGHEGGILSAGVGGPITGQGADLIVIDDPVKNRKDANSPTFRESTWEWYNDTLLTRRSHYLVPIVLTMTRWHPDDLAGRLLAEEPERWTVLRLPALAEANDPLGREIGEALWEEKMPAVELRRLQASSMDFDALYQQNPVSRGGTTMQREWFTGNRYDAGERRWTNRCVGRWISWDTAMKDKDTSDWTAFTVLELQEDYMINTREVYRERLTFPDLPATIEAVATRYNRDGKLKGVIIEDKGSGTSAYQTLQGSAPQWLRELLIPFEPPGSKEYRATLAAVWARLGCIRLPQPSPAVPWLATFEGEFFDFPSVTHDDQTDSWVQAVLYLENFISAGYDARLAAAEWAAS